MISNNFLTKNIKIINSEFILIMYLKCHQKIIENLDILNANVIHLFENK